jgi:hypothetical protein
MRVKGTSGEHAKDTCGRFQQRKQRICWVQLTVRGVSVDVLMSAEDVERIQAADPAWYEGACSAGCEGELVKDCVGSDEALCFDCRHAAL